ncbi:MAG: glycosyltransferase [Phycisphaerae bacterium]|nr:glycosyltransferase [Phycisphaerae bacterium]
MGMSLDAITETDAIRHVIREIAAGRGGFIVTANLDHLRRYQIDRTYRRLADEADLVVADGAPLIWASRVAGTPLPERVAGSDLIWSLSEAAAMAERSVYFMGGSPGAAEQASEVLLNRYQGFRVAGHECPPMGFEHDDVAMTELRARLTAAKPDIIYVALGSPKQELVIDALRSHLHAELPATWWIGVGISFSFVTGDVQRAPAVFQKLGLEWVHRLMQEPRRLARRYLVDGVPFALRLLAHAARQRLANRADSADQPVPNDPDPRGGQPTTRRNP